MSLINPQANHDRFGQTTIKKVGTRSKSRRQDSNVRFRYHLALAGALPARVRRAHELVFADEANHNPIAVLNGDRSKNILSLPAKGRSTVKLCAEGTSDP